MNKETVIFFREFCEKHKLIYDVMNDNNILFSCVGGENTKVLWDDAHERVSIIRTNPDLAFVNNPLEITITDYSLIQFMRVRGPIDKIKKYVTENYPDQTEGFNKKFEDIRPLMGDPATMFSGNYYDTEEKE